MQIALMQKFINVNIAHSCDDGLIKQHHLNNTLGFLENAIQLARLNYHGIVAESLPAVSKQKSPSVKWPNPAESPRVAKLDLAAVAKMPNHMCVRQARGCGKPFTIDRGANAPWQNVAQRSAHAQVDTYTWWIPWFPRIAT